MTNMLIPQMDESGARARPNKVLGVTEMSILLVKYTDEEGKEAVRLCVRDPGQGGVFMFADKIQGSLVARSTKSWFQEGVAHELAKNAGINEGEVESA